MSGSVAVTLLRLRAASRLLDVHWEDGTAAALSCQILRENCPCAICRQQRRKAGALAAAADLVVTAIVPRGENAVQLAFSDGHERGIFPFDYLRELHDAAPSSLGDEG